MLRDIKKHLASDDAFVEQLRKHPVGQQAFGKYNNAVSKMRNISATEKLRRATVRRGMIQPRQRFLECLATKLEPEDYTQCLDTYDTADYDRIKLVPRALKERVHHNTTNPQLKQTLATTVQAQSSRT